MDYDSDSDSDAGYEVCRRGSNSCGLSSLPFDPASLEDIVLAISDKFDFRVVLNDNRFKGAMMLTTGLTIAGGLIGKHYGGKVGAAVGGAIGGACGLGFVAVSMRDIWIEIKSKLSEVLEIVYDYLAGLGIEDYKRAAVFITENHGSSSQLAMLVLSTTSTLLGKKVLSSLTAAL